MLHSHVACIVKSQPLHPVLHKAASGDERVSETAAPIVLMPFAVSFAALNSSSLVIQSEGCVGLSAISPGGATQADSAPECLFQELWNNLLEEGERGRLLMMIVWPISSFRGSH